MTDRRVESDEVQKPSNEHRLQAESIARVKDALLDVRKLVHRERIKHRDRIMGEGPMLNAIVIDFLRKSPQRQLEILRDNVVAYESLQDGGPLVPLEDFVGPGRAEKRSRPKVHDDLSGDNLIVDKGRIPVRGTRFRKGAPD